MTTTPHWSSVLRTLDACDDGLTWAAAQPDPITAWSLCPDPIWMNWYIHKRYNTLPQSTRSNLMSKIICDCACLVVPFCVENYKHSDLFIRLLSEFSQAARTNTSTGYARCPEILYIKRKNRSKSPWFASSYVQDVLQHAFNATKITPIERLAIDHCGPLRDILVAFKHIYGDNHTTYYLRCADIIRLHIPTPPALPEPTP